MATSTAATQSAGTRYLAILAFDIRQFSAFTDTERTFIASEFRNAVEASFPSTAFGSVWHEHQFCQNAGDGVVTGFAPDHLSDILDHLPGALQTKLRELHAESGLCVRMRLGVAVGPVQDIDDERVDVAPNQPIIDACRLGDARATKMLLENSDENVTYLAVAVTPAVVADYVRTRPKWLRESQFVYTRINMDEKDYHSEAYLHVPTPSGDLLRFGLTNLPRSTASDDPDFEPLEELVARGLNELRPTPGVPPATFNAGRDHVEQSTSTGGIGRDAIGVGSGNNIRLDQSVRDDHSTHRTTRQGNVFHSEVRADGSGTVNAVGGDQHNHHGAPETKRDSDGHA